MKVRITNGFNLPHHLFLIALNDAYYFNDIVKNDRTNQNQREERNHKRRERAQLIHMYL